MKRGRKLLTYSSPPKYVIVNAAIIGATRPSSNHRCYKTQNGYYHPTGNHAFYLSLFVMDEILIIFIVGIFTLKPIVSHILAAKNT